MISKHQGLAIDLSSLKAIYIRDMELVFEFKDSLHALVNKGTGEEEMKSFPEASIVREFETIDSLYENFNRWVEMWGTSRIGNLENTRHNKP